MTNLEWLKTLSAEELADWFYDEWLHHLQYRWSSSRGGLIIWLKDRKDEPQTDNGIGCSRCEGRFDCYDRDMPHAVRCNNYGKITDEPQAERSNSNEL